MRFFFKNTPDAISRQHGWIGKKVMALPWAHELMVQPHPNTLTVSPSKTRFSMTTSGLNASWQTMASLSLSLPNQPSKGTRQRKPLWTN